MPLKSFLHLGQKQAALSDLLMNAFVDMANKAR